ncbi:MAG: NusA-like transcription termination signal-binding factor [Thermoprotei archaeon]|nr:MAG: NusA-like transcription termination signal-binding factor [Thermoprotei archaeon]
MAPVKLTDVEMKYISLVESLTGTTVIDCVIDDNNNRIIFLVKKGQAGLAVGKDGNNVKRLRRLIGKDVEIVEYSDELEELIKNSLFPARVTSVKVRKDSAGRRIVVAVVPPSEKGIAIGKDGKNIARARLLARRYFDVDNIIIQ